MAAKVIASAIAISGVTSLAQPTQAHAYILQGPKQVGAGRAAILFNRDETLKIGTGGLINMPPTNPAVGAFYIAKAGLAVIALNYYNRGLCSAYLWSVRPWDNQGFTSRKC